MKRWQLILSLIISLGISTGNTYAELYAVQTRHDQPVASNQLRLLQAAISRYERIKDQHDWTPIRLEEGVSIKPGEKSPVVVLIKERLDILGDIRRPGSTDIYTPKLEQAVRAFQIRHGLEDDGIIGPAFIKALNVTPEERIRQMRINMDRLKEESTITSGKVIVANIPEFKLYVYEDNKEVLSMDIVVGKKSNPTVVFSDTMEHVVFSPYWNVPASIVKNEIVPEMERRPGYLAKNNMEITGKRDGLPVIRQKPGPDNSLGLVKFMFPNQYDIYFHDTPAKTLFNRQKRAFSHGCIRLSKPFELAEYVLKNQSEWTPEKIREAMHSRKEQWVNLREKIPVSIIYSTAWVDQWGQLNFRDDIYGHDQEQLSLK